MLKSYFIIAWRNLWKHKTNSIINIVGMSLGLTCAFVLFNFVSYELEFDHSYHLSDRTYRVVEEARLNDDVEYRNTTAYPLADALRLEFSQLQYVTQTHGPISGIVNISSSSTPQLFEENQILFVDSVYQHVFDVIWIEGNETMALADPHSVVLTKSLAETYFPEIIERQQSVLGMFVSIAVPGEFQETFTVTGLIDDPPPNVTFRYRLLLPYAYYQKVDTYATTNWSGNYQGTTFVTLSQAQDVSEIESLLPSFKSKYLSPEDNASKDYYLQPLAEMHSDTTYGHAPGSYVIARKYLYVLMSLALLILIIAAANYISLSTAQVFNRAKEIGVRKAIGSTRSELAKQFLCETIMVSLLAAAFALLLLPNVLKMLNEQLSMISLQLSLDGSMLWTVIILTVVLTFLAGVYPSLIASGIHTRGILGFGSFPSSASKQRSPIKKSLLVLQFTICQILVAATLVVAWQIAYMSEKELGFQREEIVTVPIPAFDLEQLDALKFRLSQSSSIENITFSSGNPTSHDIRLGTTFRLKGAGPDEKRPAEMKVVDEDYLKTYELKLIAGSGITPMKEDGQIGGFVVNETLVNALGLSAREAIGKEIIINEGQAIINGVVADFNNSSLKEEISPCLIFNWYSGFFWEAGIKTSTGDMTSTLGYIKQTWQEFFPQSVFRFQFLKDYLNSIYGLESLLLLFVKAATILAIFMGCMGLYGLLVFSIQQRTKEIGLRKVLGASTADLLTIFSSEYFRLITLSFIIATPVSWYLLNNWLNGFVYRIDIGLGVFLLTFTAILIIALVTVSTRLWKVMVMNPVDSIRNE